MKKTAGFSLSFTHISLALVGLMWVFPFLYYHHAYPITTFYQEWGTALLGVCALPLLLTARYWQAPQVPRIVLLPIGLLLLALLQFFVGRLLHFDQVLLLALYFLFAALLMLLGRQLREELGLSYAVAALAMFLLAGAELDALAGILQHYRWHSFLDAVVTVKTSDAVYGNTAQPNHFANYVALGLFSLGLLSWHFKWRVWAVALLATPLLFVMMLSGSRSAWLYLSFAAALAWGWQRRDAVMRPLWRYAALLLAGFFIMAFVVQIPWLQGAHGGYDSVQRMFGDARSGSIRLLLWQESLRMLAHFPVLGAGFGQFAYQHFQLAAEVRNPQITGLYNNVHNIVLQLGVEAGIAGIGILLATLVLWLKGAWQQAQRTPYHWWGYSVLAVQGIHSLLEYPLWYLYFIGIAAVVLGMFDSASFRLELRSMGRLSVATMLLLGVLALAQGMRSYKHLENSLMLRSLAASDVANVARARDELLTAHQYPLFSSYAELFIANMMEPSADHLREKLELNERMLRFIPVASVAYHQAWLLALSDRQAAAREVLEKAIWAYPEDFPSARTELTGLAGKDPARFAALLEFATQKYEEYRSAAVPGK